MRRRGWVLLLAGLIAGVAMSQRAEAFGGRRRGGAAYSYSGAGGRWVGGSSYAPRSAGYYYYPPGYGGARPGGYAGGGMPGSGYGGGYYGLQGYNNPSGGLLVPGYGGYGYGYGYGGMRR